MTLNEREAFEYWADARCYYLDKREDGHYEKGSTALAWVIAQYFMEVGRNQELEKAKAQAVPDNSIIVPRSREVVVAIEKMVEQQVEASGITSDVFRLDGWRILDAIQEASESGAEG